MFMQMIEKFDYCFDCVASSFNFFCVRCDMILNAHDLDLND